MKKYFLLIFFLTTAYAQAENNPDEILNNVKEKFAEVKDYVVDASIKVDVNFLRVPETNATIYFKQPDKIKLESDSFALLPKQGLNFSPSVLLDGNYTSIYVKEDTVGSSEVSIIKVIPNSDTTDIVLSTLWVDTKNSVVRKIETTTKKSGTISIQLDYGSEISYGLPSMVKFSFKVEGIQLPPGMTGKTDNDNEGKRGRNKGPMTGTVIVNYNNYKINQGLKDEFFKEKDEKVNSEN